MVELPLVLLPVMGPVIDTLPLPLIVTLRAVVLFDKFRPPANVVNAELLTVRLVLALAVFVTAPLSVRALEPAIVKTKLLPVALVLLKLMETGLLIAWGPPLAITVAEGYRTRLPTVPNALLLPMAK